MKKHKRLSATAFMLFFVMGVLFGQENKEKKEKKVNIIPLPVIASNPTTGFMFGFAPGFNWRMGDPTDTHMSTALGVAIYTANQQLFTSLRSNAFISGDRWNLLTDVRFALNSQPTYGLGTDIKLASGTIVGDDGEVSDDPYNKVPRQEMMAFTQIRLYQTFLKRHQDTRFYYGLGYHLDIISNIQDKQLDLDADPPRETFHFQHQTLNGISTERYSQSGISLNAAFDNRDNVANPYEGRYALARFTVNPEFLGSTTNTSQLWLEYRDYFTLNKDRPRNLLAFGPMVGSRQVAEYRIYFYPLSVGTCLADQEDLIHKVGLEEKTLSMLRQNGVFLYKEKRTGWVAYSFSIPQLPVIRCMI